MSASVKTKFYSSKNTNSPQNNLNYGALIDILDACLVNGFGAQLVSSMTAIDKTVTVNFGQAHNFLQYQVIKISGANQSEYNGEHRILTITTNTITFAVDTTPSITTATGTITCSLPPLDFEKTFSSKSTLGKRAAYRSKNTLLPARPFLRVLDERVSGYNAQYAMYAKVGIVENMTSIDVMSGVQAPYTSSEATRNWSSTGSGDLIKYGWARWYYAFPSDNAADISKFSDYSSSDLSAPEWFLIGNGDTFFLCISASYYNAESNYKTKSFIYGFGAFESLIDNDTSNTFLSSTLYWGTAISIANRASYTGMKGGYLAGYDSNPNICLQRGVFNKNTYAQAYTLSPYYSLPESGNVNNTQVSSQFGGVVFYKPTIAEKNPSSDILYCRGVPPFLYHMPHSAPFTDLQCFSIGNKFYIAKDTMCISSTRGQVVFCLNEE